MDVPSYLLASSYPGAASFFNGAAAVCTINGQPADCGPFIAIATTFGVFFLVMAIILLAIMIVSAWKIFVKAGKPGWAALIPIYNLIVFLQIIKKPLWWIILFFIPIISIIVSIVTHYELAKSFGKGAWFTAGLVVLPIIFYPILAFDNSVYTPPQDLTTPQV